MNLIPISVYSYEGYKADEYPKYFYLYNLLFEIEELIDRWYQSDSNSDVPASDYYKVKTTGGTEYIIKHELKNNQWFIRL